MNTQSTISDDEYIGQDGRIYCKNCNTPRRTEEMDYGKHRRIMCECEAEERKKEERIVQQQAKARNVARMKKMSLLGEKYKDASFSSVDIHSEELGLILSRCQKYCTIAPTVLERGYGIYLFGNKGTGKTHLTACMVNSLIEQGYTALCTNFSEISKKIKSTFKGTGETEAAFIQRLTDIDFLFIDDFGTEKVAKGDEDLWLQEKVFEIVNKRYVENKPIIFTSNYSLRELIEERGVADKTVDRINEMCTVMKLEGSSYRQVIKKTREILF